MSTVHSGLPVEMRRASVESIDDVLGILDDAAGWLSAREIRQWPARFTARYVRPAIEAGDTWLGYVDGDPAATVTISWSDPLWEPDDGKAGYLHRLAIKRTAAGAGILLLDWAAATALDRGRPLLRLDCVAENSRLRQYYESAGFRHRGDIRESGAPYALLSRYEKRII